MKGAPLDDFSATGATSGLDEEEEDEVAYDTDDGDIDARLRTIQLGVWTVTVADGDVKEQKESIFSYLPVVRRMFCEVYRVDAWAIKVLLLSKFFGALQPTLLLYFFSRLLGEIEKVLVTGTVDMTSIYRAIYLRLGCVAAVALFDWWFQGTLLRLQSRIQRHFKAALLEAKLRTNIPTSLQPTSAGKVSAKELAQYFLEIFSLLDSAINAASLITFVVASASASVGGGPLFPILCVAKPLLTHFGGRFLWSKPHIIHTTNELFLRMKGLAKMAKLELREEIITADLADHVMHEFRVASAELRNLADTDPFMQYSLRPTPTYDMFTALAGDLPIIYCVLSAAASADPTSVSSVAILQQSAQTFLEAVSMALFYFDRLREYASHFEQYYQVIEAPVTENVLADGELDYPLATSSEKGMGFELKNVDFAYPGDPDKAVLRGVNISIKPGQLVVIVGANGSGKSSLVKLLARIYDPAGGAILLDGTPLPAYRQRAFRRATAVLAQGHHLFPLSMGENIGLGHAARAYDTPAVRAAAAAGGADACIAKLRGGLDAVLDPQARASGSNLVGREGAALRRRLNALDKPLALSGGETQRIVAARTFMRLKSGQVRAVLVDEPSSALDAEGELALFDNLRAEREGKTMIFVTHRFGHLTKYADQIICMKDGKVVERGVHDELIAMDGEYKKLYDIQASAFVAST